MACSCDSETILGCGCCCGSNECVAPEASTGPVGPTGATGAAGTDGEDGLNAFTTTTSTYIQPPVGNSVVIPVINGLFAAPTQPIFVQGGGFYTVVSVTSTSITATNLGVSGYAAPAAVVATNRVVGPGGYAGVLIAPLPIASGGTGQASAALAFDALSPMSVTGDLISRSAGSNVRIAAGTSDFILKSGGVGVLPTWSLNSPAAANITGQVAIANGGTSASTASAARTALAIPGLAANNIFTGTQQFNGSSIQGTAAGLPSFIFSSAARYIYDLSGVISVDFNTRLLQGPWRQTQKLYTIANGATFSAWTNLETLISTYSVTGSQTITLPAGTDGRVVRIVDGGGNASVNNISISRSGSDTIMGDTVYSINNNYGSISLIFLSATTNWVPLP